MNITLKNYLTMQTHLFPDDPALTFLPFVVNTIIKKDIIKTSYESFSSIFTEFNNFTLPYHILKDIFEKMLNDKTLVKTTSAYECSTAKIKDKYTLIDDTELQTYNNNLEKLMSSFSEYVNDENFTNDELENVILDFVRENDYEILLNDYKEDNKKEDNVLMLFWVEYLKEIMKLNSDEYKTVLKICEGSLIKSFIFDDVDSTDIYKGTKVFIDTPILLKLLGYYGEYIQREFKFLFESWKNQGGSFYIFNHNYDECCRILRTAQEWVEKVEIDITKTSDVCIFFREKGYNTEDVEFEIINLRDKLSEFGISEYQIDFNKNQDNMIDAHYVRSLIVDFYSRHSEYEYSYRNNIDDFIDVDVKSIVYSYFIRENNFVHTFKEAKLIFLTENKSLYYIARTFQQDNFGDTISPLQLDSFIGKIICSNNMNNISLVTENRIISYCVNIFKPTHSLKEAYNKKIIDMRKNKEITNEDYHLLKNYRILNEELVKKTRGIPKNISNETIYYFLDKVRTDLVSDISKQYETEKKELIQDTTKKIEEKEQEIIDIKSSYEKEKKAITFNQNLKKNSMVEKELNQYVKRVELIFLFAFTALMIFLHLVYFLNLFRTNNNVFMLIFNILLSIVTIYGWINSLRRRSEIIKKMFFVKNKKVLLENKYSYFLSEDSKT
ncbi:MAG: hypothetical protein AB7V77_06020 [Candidatus Woesearchaeota archaeon]